HFKHLHQRLQNLPAPFARPQALAPDSSGRRNPIGLRDGVSRSGGSRHGREVLPNDSLTRIAQESAFFSWKEKPRSYAASGRKFI
ncbi:MAG: hypothetical protein LBQ32_06995, partial [Burkholderiaceae bacterium]|nr:hypothetical protein [Burkholderiaceae bacterium]